MMDDQQQHQQQHQQQQQQQAMSTLSSGAGGGGAPTSPSSGVVVDLLSGDLDNRNNINNNMSSSNNNGLLASDDNRRRPESNTNYVSMELGGVVGGGVGRSTAPPVPPVPDYDEDETDDDEQSVSPSIVSSVMTAGGIHDVPGFICVCFVILIGDMSRGVMFPSMWPLVENLGGNSVTLGYAVASFSFGRILVNPIFGSWSHQIGYSKTLMLACAILLAGTLLYAQIQNVGRPEFLIVSQTLLGIGSGTLGVTRAFVADVTAKRERTTYMAWITAVQYAGFTVTPVFGALFNYLLNDREYKYGIFRLNMFTAPAYFMSLVVASTLALLFAFFRDRQRIDTAKGGKNGGRKSARRVIIEDVANTTTFVGLTVYDCCILGCMLLNVSTKGSIASFETLGIAIAQSHFDMLSSRAGAIVAGCGTVGVLALLSMGYLAQRYNDVQLISGGMVVMALGIASLSTISEEVANPTWRYFLAIFMIYGVGYPIGHTAVIGLFSKIVGRRPQGTLLGWFASAGSLARMFFPVMSGYVANYKDVETLFILLTTVLVISTAFVMLARGTLLLLSS